MRFTKMHGLGNDYVYIETFTQPAPPAGSLPQLARTLADRHFGVGGDGLILVMPPDQQTHPNTATCPVHAVMRMFNLDGSEGEMCGNGIRCVAKLVIDRQLAGQDTPTPPIPTPENPIPLRVQTACGVLELHANWDDAGRVASVRVEMGRPILQADDIPIRRADLVATATPQTWSIPLDQEGTFEATMVSMGNPHAVIFVEVLDPARHARIGPRLEHHRAFPNRMNVHFVQVISPDRVKVYHWERGSGPTLACGTGACAVAVAGHLTGRTQREITAELPGGALQLAWDESTDVVHMTGPAVTVFDGELDASMITH